MSKEEAAAAYQAALSPGNAKTDEANNYVQDGQVRKGCALQAEAVKLALANLDAIGNWPPDVAVLLKNLRPLYQAERKAFLACAAAPSDDAASALTSDAMKASTKRLTLTQAVRQLLGLPPSAG